MQIHGFVLTKRFNNVTKIELLNFLMKTLNTQRGATKFQPSFTMSSSKSYSFTSPPTFHRRAVDTFERLDMPYFIAYGTLLGWYRECGFIKHTTDVDFGIPIEDAYRDKDLIIRELAKVGIIYTHSLGNKEMGFELKFKDNETNSRMDIFAFYHEWVEEDHEQKERLYSSVWNYQYFTRKLVFPLTEFTRVNLSGIITRAPKNVCWESGFFF